MSFVGLTENRLPTIEEAWLFHVKHEEWELPGGERRDAAHVDRLGSVVACGTGGLTTSTLWQGSRAPTEDGGDPRTYGVTAKHQRRPHWITTIQCIRTLRRRT